MSDCFRLLQFFTLKTGGATLSTVTWISHTSSLSLSLLMSFTLCVSSCLYLGSSPSLPLASILLCLSLSFSTSALLCLLLCVSHIVCLSISFYPVSNSAPSMSLSLSLTHSPFVSPSPIFLSFYLPFCTISLSAPPLFLSVQVLDYN